jgi:hypothetical protein
MYYNLHNNFLIFWDYTFKWRWFAIVIEYLYLKGQSHEKVGEIRVWGISLGPDL